MGPATKLRTPQRPPRRARLREALQKAASPWRRKAHSRCPHRGLLLSRAPRLPPRTRDPLPSSFRGTRSRECTTTLISRQATPLQIPTPTADQPPSPTTLRGGSVGQVSCAATIPNATCSL